LEVAFTTLIANRAIKRMVEEEKFKNSFTGFTDKRCFGVDNPTFWDRPSTRYNRLWRLLNFNKASTAVTCNRKRLMVTKTRNLNPCGLAGLKNGCVWTYMDKTVVNGNREERGHQRN
jgi:hypothetical protein